MHVEVEHALRTGLAVRLKQVHAGRAERCTRSARHSRDRSKHGTGLSVVKPEHILDVGFGRDQHMPRVDLAEVHEGKRMVVLANDVCGNLFCDNPAEYAVRHVIHSFS